MKRLLLLSLTFIPFFSFSGNFVYGDYGDCDGECWYDEYWYHEPCCDCYWVYYPYGYYCVYYVWYHPWWWDWYWWRCRWCHHFDWHFFVAGFYVVWYENGCWWWRPRYGRWVRYKMPYTYHEIRYKAREYGVYLPDKPPREINVPYREKEVMRLTKEKDPELYARLAKENRTGNLEKMRREYEVKIKREIAVKRDEYRLKNPRERYWSKTGEHKNYVDKEYLKPEPDKDDGPIKRKTYIIKREKGKEDSYQQYRDSEVRGEREENLLKPYHKNPAPDSRRDDKGAHQRTKSFRL